MRNLRNAVLMAALAFASWAARAEVKTVTLSLPSMEAVVTYDDSKTTLEALTKATANAGYPSTPKQ